jgi:NAD-dependent DNA ligase
MSCPENCCVGVTGSLETMTIDAAIRLLHEAGCAYAYTISPNTTCLVVGANPSGADLTKAEKYNIQIVWEEQFFKQVTQHRCSGVENG